MKDTKDQHTVCRLKEAGHKSGSCIVDHDRACQVTLKWEGKTPHRLIKSAHLSRPEHYFSVYQSGCNFSCQKCHSWYFTKHATGKWLSPKAIGELAKEYGRMLTYWEPRGKATDFHAHDLCLSCGACVTEQKRGQYCPGVLQPDQIVFSPQGWGPARNIIGFTGGDLVCQPDFYCSAAEEIKKQREDLWILLETNGYGLTATNLDKFKTAGIDSFWLDIKAYDDQVHRKLTECSNERILKLPQDIRRRGFTLEVLSLYIPGWVEADQLRKIARTLADVDPQIPYTILAFFPEYQMKAVSSPSFEQMLDAYKGVKDVGLLNVRLGNIGVFVKTEDQLKVVMDLGM